MLQHQPIFKTCTFLLCVDIQASLWYFSSEDNVIPQYGGPAQSMKLGGLLRGYHPARKCLKTGEMRSGGGGIKIGSADFIKDGSTMAQLESFEARL